MNKVALLMGLAGGLASALLFAAVLGGGALATPLFALSPLPVAIAALGWGTVSGAVAALLASAVIGTVMAPVAGLVLLLASAGPIAWYGHLVGLARPREDGGGLEWYPLGRVFTAMALLTPVTLIACGAILGLSVDEIAGELADLFAAGQPMTPGGAPVTREEILADMRMVVRIMPVTFSMLWLSLMVLNLWLAGRIVLRSERLRRPWEPMPEAPALPAFVSIAFLVAAVLAFRDGPFALAMGAVAGSLGMALAFQGFATLHVVTRGNPARGLILGALYGATFVFSLPLLPAAALGAIDSLLGIRRRRPAPTT
jgi:hypothetical protein